ncbi:MAG: MBL fold metallo-hydrolase, partial [FCB group bacterium]|nr:MBL fold metallo-hydrolase [FCB group bacterium]
MLSPNKRQWNKNKEIYIWIFNVGRGFSSFIKTPHNYGMMIDCGTSENIAPFKDVIEPHFLRYLDSIKYKKTIAKLVQVIVTHPHSDHCLEIDYVLKNALPMLLTTPHSNPDEADTNLHVNWDLVNNPEYGKSAVEVLKDSINGRTPPLREYVKDIKIAVPGFDFKIFYIPPKLNERTLPATDYVNNLSIVAYLKLGNASILFLGDLMPSGCEYLLRNNE